MTRSLRANSWPARGLFAAVGLLAALALAACATPGRPSNEGAASLEKARPRRPGVRAVLVVMPDSPTARAALEGLEQEVVDEFDVVPRVVGEQVTPEEVGRAVREVRPAAVVLVNNTSVRAYRAFQQTATAEEKNLRAVGLLSSFLRETVGGAPNLSGVIYEVPLVTTLVNLRALLKQPIKRVGVLHRAVFRGYIAEQRELIAPEGFELVGVEVPGGQPDQVGPALERLRNEKVDAIWVLNDNALLERDMLQKGWLPALRGNRTPVVVNVGSLISRRVSFGTFGVLPDHRRLGAQAGAMIGTLAERGFAAGPGEFEFPVSVETVLDVDFARKNLEVEERMLAKVDRLVE